MASLKEKLTNLLKKRAHKLNEIYEAYPTIAKTTIRGRLNENTGTLFTRMAEGLYIATTGEYDIIAADPPWSYNNNKGRGVANNHYETMRLEDLKQLPVSKMCGKNAVLFMWVTMPMLDEGLELIKAWGFKYKTCGFNWIKQTKKETIFIGMGYYTRSNAEVCLLAVKGKGLPVLNHTISQVILSQREKHSQKPAEAYSRITQLYGNECKKLEMFARQQRLGWDVFGNEV
jgi:N6-adenosine-specific RNA methylase IME4